MSQVIFYINIYRSGVSYSISSPYKQETQAEESGKSVIGYITTVPVEFDDEEA